MAGAIAPHDAKARVHAAGEIAMLDVREHGQYGEGHPFLAVPCPYSRLEMAVGALVPRRSVPVLLVDDGDGIAEKAAAILRELGYGDVSWIAGGAPAWEAAGFTLFKGVNLPSKTLGELLEERWHVPRIDVETLDAWQRQGRAFRLFDGRPASEHRKMTIPGATSMPNGELPHRFEMLIEDGTTPVVVHCAGRTRSLVGAAGLALAGIPNPVFALEDGTQGWVLSGRRLEHGRITPSHEPLEPAARSTSAVRAEAMLTRRAIPAIDRVHLARLAADRSRTLYVFDVRTSEEHAEGSIAGAVHAPTVQLAQATDHWIGVRRARVVLFDDTGLRAAITAVFLRALNYEVFVLRAGDAGAMLPPGAPAHETRPKRREPEPIDAAEALRLAQEGAPLLDLRLSLAYREGHLEGARWSIRPRLSALPLDLGRPVLLVASPETTTLATRDLEGRGLGPVRRVSGNPAAWKAAGLPVVASPAEPPDAEAIDHLFFVHDRHDGNLEAARRYLAWEKGLVGQLDAAESTEFRLGESPFLDRAAG